MTTDPMPPIGEPRNIPVMDLAVIFHSGEPRVLDLDLGERLGFARPRDIRKIIDRNLPEIERFGFCATVAQNHEGGRGRPTAEYLLNEEQALLVAVLSNAPRAPEVRAMLIKVFVAWRRGHLAAAPSPALTVEGLDALVGQLLEARLTADPRAIAVGYKPALEILKDRKVPARGRRKLSQQASSRLRRFCIDQGHTVRVSRETGRYLYPPEAVTAWLKHEGDQIIRDHVAAVQGQGVLRLVPPTRAG